jgi:uncharacterized protein (TIGR03790 family)
MSVQERFPGLNPWTAGEKTARLRGRGKHLAPLSSPAKACSPRFPAQGFSPGGLALLLLLLLTTACQAASSAARVLVIVNDNSPASKQIGTYYAAKRHISAGNICHLHCPVAEEIDEAAFLDDILTPVATMLARPALAASVDYLVLTKGVPLRIHSDAPAADPRFTPNGDSVDGRLMCQDIAGLSSPSKNPFFNSAKRFSHKLTGLYLATRLDGYTVQDAEALVDRALAAKPASGTFLLDGCPSRNGGGDPPEMGLPPLNASLNTAAKSLKARGYGVILDQSDAFIGHTPNLMGYWSWGSNDSHFDAGLYKSNRFRPGAIAETIVSTSARTMLPTTGGQSLIADLVVTGVTGVKGYVAEPYTIAMARADILFDRYTRGWNLAESFYCASPLMHWKDLVLGDPLCAPYAK